MTYTPKDEEANSLPWKGICRKNCWNARSKRCRCKCAGFYHGSHYKGKQITFSELAADSPAGCRRGGD